MPINQQPAKTPMPEQPGEVRAHNFEEVAQGYTADMAVNEAQRCLHCKHRPCVSGCPVNVQIPDFIALIASGDFEARIKIGETNALPAVCGRVCPQENQCESKCVRGLKGSRWPSAAWNGLPPTYIWPPDRKASSVPRKTAIRWPLWVPALPA